MDYGFETAQLLEQSQVMTQQMIQSLKVLQMPSAELYDYITSEIEANPVITFDSLDFAERARHAPRYNSDAENETYNNATQIPTNENSPIISLRIQLSMKKPPADVERIGYTLINLLDKNGYLNDSDIEYLTRRLGVPFERVSLAVKLLQSLEPAGIGARSLKECILLQLDRLGLKNGDAWIITEKYLSMLGKNQLPMIAKKSGIPLERIAHAKNLIRTLNPHPLMLSEQTHTNHYIVPDIRIFRKDEGNFVIELNQLRADSIIIDNAYAQIFKNTDSESVRTFLNQNIKKANWLKDSIRQRCETLNACASRLLIDQHQFFEHGPSALKPYSRKDMAEKIEKSESTISRAFKDKYIECDWGLFPSDYFFPKHAREASPSATRNTVWSCLVDIVKSEDPQNPLSDEALSEKLFAQGFKVSRRTVSKYRGELGIPSSGRRKIFK